MEAGKWEGSRDGSVDTINVKSPQSLCNSGAEMKVESRREEEVHDAFWGKGRGRGATSSEPCSSSPVPVGEACKQRAKSVAQRRAESVGPKKILQSRGYSHGGGQWRFRSGFTVARNLEAGRTVLEIGRPGQGRRNWLPVKHGPDAQ